MLNHFEIHAEMYKLWLINVKMPTMVDILIFMSRKNSILGLSEPKKKPNFLIFLYL